MVIFCSLLYIPSIYLYIIVRQKCIEVKVKWFLNTLMSSGFFDDAGSAAETEFLKSASALRESYRFAHTNVDALLKKHNVEGE